MRWVLALLAGCTLSVDDFDGDGWSAGDGDCDDLDADVNPHADDLSHDSVDQNCDGDDFLMRDAGVAHECTLLDGGDVDCIGDNSYGQLDIPAHDDDFVQIAAGDYHTCGLDGLGFVTCWGDDTYGQSTPPFREGYGAVDADANYSIGILAGTESRAICWGLCRVEVH